MRTQREEEPEPETRMPRRQPTLRAGTSKRAFHYPSPEMQLMTSEREMEKQVKTKSNKDGFSDQHRVLVANTDYQTQSLPEPTQGTAAQKEGLLSPSNLPPAGFVIWSNPGLDTAQNRERHWEK